MEIIAFDSHKRYTVTRVEDVKGMPIEEARILHQRGHVREYLKRFTQGSTVAVETIGNWYWIVDEIEDAGMRPALVHARKAKLMMGTVNKTDRLDVRGLAMLQRMGTLPQVWIPSAELRDKRDIARTRMMLAGMRVKLKNRIHSVFAKYALHDFGETTDIFGVTNRTAIEERITALPPETQFTTRCLLEELETLQVRISALENRMAEVFNKTPEVELLMTLPGIGPLLSVVIAQEMGAVGRFASSERFAAYAGTTPRVHASGGRTRFGPLRPDVNRYLKWAFVEAANAVCRLRNQCPHRHVNTLYERIRARKGHQKAIGAVARHLAEAAYCVVMKREPYKERGVIRSSSRKA